MTWLLRPAVVPASDEGWGRAALMQGDAAAAVRAFRGHDDGAEFADTDLPRALRLGLGGAPDLFALRTGLLVASDALRGVVEDLEPGRHRFWSLTVRGGAGTRHGLIVRAFGRALSEARSDCHVDPAEPTMRLPRHVALVGEAAVDPARLPDAHLWWDRALSEPYLLCSDALADRLAALDVPGLHPCR